MQRFELQIDISALGAKSINIFFSANDDNFSTRTISMPNFIALASIISDL